MIRNFWKNVLALFGKENMDENTTEQYETERYTSNYEDTSNINFEAIFSNKLSNYTLSDSNIDIEGDNARSELLRDTLKRLMKNKRLKKTLSRTIGTGGCLVVPYVANGKVYFDIVSQSRLKINKKIGEDIVDCTLLADHVVRNQKNYYRWTDYTLENGILHIRYKATLESSPIELTEIEEWSNIEDIAITNVDKMPFMFLISPIDNRKESDDYGAPITYGCEKQISRVLHDLEMIDREYDLKQCFIGADITMFKGEGALPLNGLYKKINAGEDTFWETFDPAYRDEPLFRKLAEDFSLLEKQIGTSEGILTKLDTNNATATEIKKKLKDTFDLVDDIRDALEYGLKDFFYACDVLADYYNLTPIGEYELKCDWSYSLLEDTQQEFSQLMQGRNQGVVSKAELRQFIKPHETLEEAEEVVKRITLEEPSTKDLLGE